MAVLVPDGSSGASSLIDWVLGCPDQDNPIVIDTGDWIDPEPGAVQATVIQAFKTLVEDFGDDNWTWDAGAECMSQGGLCMDDPSFPVEWFAKRHRAIALIDPTPPTTNQDPAQLITESSGSLMSLLDYCRNLRL